MPDESALDTDYDLLATQLESLMAGERDLVANLANASAVMAEALDCVNWVGFYRLLPAQEAERGREGQTADTRPAVREPSQGELVLGPFQGKPACIRIPVGRGVCGAAAATGETQLVPDVHAFPGHIACDAASRSEVVVPLWVDGRIVGVLDIDSPMPGRFSQRDRIGLERCARMIEAAWERSHIES